MNKETMTAENKEKTIDQMYAEVKQREISELYNAVKTAGGNVKFDEDENENPYVSGWLNDEPSDFCITEVSIDENNSLSIYGYPKDGYSEDEDVIDPFDIAYGHIQYITEQVGRHGDNE